MMCNSLVLTQPLLCNLVFCMVFLLLAQWCFGITHDIVWRMGVESNALVKPIRQTIPWTRRVWQQKACGERFLSKPCLTGLRWQIPVYRLVCQTIFAFLTLNTMSPANEEIFGAKFSSFERAMITYLRTVDYAGKERSVQWIRDINKHNWLQ